MPDQQQNSQQPASDNEQNARLNELKQQHEILATDVANRKLSAEIRELAAREETDRYRLNRAIDSANQAYESFKINGQVFVDRRDYLPTGFGFNRGWFGGIAPYHPSREDRREGRYAPFILTQQDLDNSRAMARWVSTIDCIGVGVGETLKNYIVGKGFQYTVGTKKHSQAPEGLVATVQDVIDEFIDDNDFTGDLDRELLWRSRQDGEFFLALYPQAGGRTAARAIEPEQVIDPGSAPWSEEELLEHYGVDCTKCASNFTFGIHTPDHDVQTVYGYCVEWDHGEIDYVPERRLVHFKENVPRNIKRGLSDFFPAWRWLKLESRLLENTAEGAAKLAAIAYIIEHVQGVDEDQIYVMRQRLADAQYTTTTPTGASKTWYEEYDVPGTKLDVPHGQIYKHGPMGAERGQAFLWVLAGILRQLAARWQMPEGMIGADDSNNNRASSIVAGDRFYRYATASQSRIGAVYAKILWTAIQHAHNSGRFSRVGFGPNLRAWHELMHLIELDVTPPDVDERSALDKAQERAILKTAGVLSVKTWRALTGLDNETEEQNCENELVKRKAILEADAKRFGPYP